MTLYRSDWRTVKGPRWSPLIALCALAALLLGIFAIHAEASAHDVHAAPSSSAERGPLAGAIGVAALAGATSDARAVPATAQDGALQCALFGMLCALLLAVISTVILLVRQRSFYLRLLDAGGLQLGLLRSMSRFIEQPSLTLLSISRV